MNRTTAPSPTGRRARSGLRRVLGVVALTATFAIGLTALAAPVASAAAGSDTLVPGESLSRGQQLVSPNRAYVTTLQGDGNLVTTRSSDGAVLWNAGSNGADVLAFQPDDGNVVAYQGSTPRFFTGQGTARFVQQDDGALVAYRADNSVVWSNNQTWRWTASAQLIGRWSQTDGPGTRFFQAQGSSYEFCGRSFNLRQDSDAVFSGYISAKQCFENNTLPGGYTSDKWVVSGNTATRFLEECYWTNFPPNGQCTVVRSTTEWVRI